MQEAEEGLKKLGCPKVNLQVRATNGCGFQLDLHVTGADHRLVHVDDLAGRGGAMEQLPAAWRRAVCMSPVPMLIVELATRQVLDANPKGVFEEVAVDPHDGAGGKRNV